MDAAIASAFVLFVVEPDMSHLAGQAHILVRPAEDEPYHHIDAYSFAPASAHATMFRWERAPTHGNYRYRTQGDRNTTGATSVAVPATLVGLERLHGLGASLTWADLLRPAVELAEHGFTIGGPLAKSLEAEWPRLQRFPEFRRVYGEGGRAKRAGERLVQKDLADTLRLVAVEGASALHGGSLGTAVADEIAASGGLVTANDLRSAPERVTCRPALRSSYFGYEVHTAGSSSTGGMLLRSMLEEHEHALGEEAADTCAARLAAMKRAFEQRPAYLVAATGTGANVSSHPRTDEESDPCTWRENNTTHHSHLDEQGCAVALTQSIGDPFGSGLIPKGTGLLLNNAMKLFDPRPERPGSIRGGRKGLSTMTPTILSRHGAPILALGSPSGTRIVSAVFQALAELLAQNASLKTAVEAPRLHWDGEGIDVEAGHPDIEYLQSLTSKLDRYPRQDPWFGGVQAVGYGDLQLDGALVAVTDPRRPSFGGAVSALPVRTGGTDRSDGPGDGSEGQP